VPAEDLALLPTAAMPGAEGGVEPTFDIILLVKVRNCNKVLIAHLEVFRSHPLVPLGVLFRYAYYYTYQGVSVQRLVWPIVNGCGSGLRALADLQVQHSLSDCVTLPSSWPPSRHVP